MPVRPRSPYKVTPGHRAKAFWLHERGLSQRDIARVLGLSQPTVGRILAAPVGNELEAAVA
ncbi:MAG: helix-turn-helix domain-containing protein [Chloroflexi bacterium]|nr:MAG: helix-turn-helix domain-containing protein [Chloroflexota bacterium]